MITVPEVVAELVKQSPFLEEALSQGLINNSSLARKMQPEIEKRLYKNIQIGAIVMALKRLSKKIQHKESKLSSILRNIFDITVRSNLVELTFKNSESLIEKHKQLVHQISTEKTIFFTTSYGVFETSVFISSSMEKQAEQAFQDEDLKHRMNNLSAITLIIPEEATFIPGVYYSVLKTLAWEGINFIEVVSSYTELTIILENSSVDKAFSILKRLA